MALNNNLELPIFSSAEWCTKLPVITDSDSVAGSEALQFFTLLGLKDCDSSDGSVKIGEMKLCSGGAQIRLVPIATKAEGDGPVVKFTVNDVEKVRALVETMMPSWIHPSSVSGPTLRPHGLQWTALDVRAESCIWFVQPQTD